jgi:molecular chaperone GrpE
MSDAAPPFQPANANGQSPHGALTPERIERALADFRDWLSDPPAGETLVAPERESVDLHGLVAQFIALRHEVNLQTKATRASLEQNADALKRLDEAIDELRIAPEESTSDDATHPLLKALIDCYDALALSLGQVERQKSAIVAGLETVLQAADIEAPPALANGVSGRPGFWQRLFGASNSQDSANELQHWRERVSTQAKQRDEKVRAAVDFLKQALDSLITGYSMSLNRIDRVLPQFGLERIDCIGERFDPEIMEVVDVVASADRPAGEVVEEVRRGYRWNGSIFRYAQVRVTRCSATGG